MNGAMVKEVEAEEDTWAVCFGGLLVPVLVRGELE